MGSALVGRLAELETLEGLISRGARSGRAGLIEGEAGIGKTRLLEAALARARELGFRVFSAAAEELEIRRPFGIIADCLNLRPPAPPSEWEPGAEFQVVEDFVALVDHLMVDGPLALGFDDVQWADPSSLVVLHRLIRHLAGLPLLVLVTARPWPRPAELRRFLGGPADERITRLHLGPVPAADCEVLVAAMLGATPGPRLRQLVEGANGNPLFVAELVGGLVSAGAVDIDAQGTAETSSQILPSNVTTAILHRLSFLSLETLELLSVASILGATFSAADLSLLSGQRAARLLGALREAVRAEVLEERADQLAFRHALIREVLYDDLPRSVRKGLHADLWRRLAASGAAPIRVAEHITRAGSAGDRVAVRWLRRAAREVGPLAPAASVDLLERALDLTEPSDVDRRGILADLAVSLLWAGRLHDGEARCRQALDQVGGVEGESWMRLCLAQAYVLLDRAADARREAEQAASAQRASPVERVRAVAWASLARLHEGDVAGAVAQAERAQCEAEHLGDAAARCQALATLSLAADFRGRFADAVELARAAACEADHAGTREAHRALAHLIQGRALADVDRLEESGEAIRRGRQICERMGARGALPSHHFTAALRGFAAGDWDDALAELETGLDLAEEMGIGWRTPAYATAALIALHRDELRAAQRWLRRLDADQQVPGSRYQLDRARWVRALLLEAEGHVDEAATLLGAAWDACEHAGLLAELPVLGPDLVRLAVRRGDTGAGGRAARTARSVAMLAEQNADVPWVAGAALRCLGLAADDAGLLLQAVASYRRGPRPLELAEACESAGATLLRRGDVAQARALFDEAHGLYERLQARRDVRRVNASLRAAGVRRGVRARHRPKLGWQALTETELAVVGLVSERLSNPEIAQRLFLSRRTVQTHVSHALAKLEVSSRLDLAAEARAHGDSGDR